MILGALALDERLNEHLFRSSSDISSSQMSYFITEFTNEAKYEGILEKDGYFYIYTTIDNFKVCFQCSKDSMIFEIKRGLDFISKQNINNLFDILNIFDEILVDGSLFLYDIEQVLTMESQEEKIYEIMMKSKEKESIQLQKEKRIANLRQRTTEPTKKVIKKSEKPCLILINEKINFKINKENEVLGRTLNGSVSVVFYEEECKDILLEIEPPKLKKINANPDLDQSLLKENKYKFTKNKNLDRIIPLIKWKGVPAIPITVDLWEDEENEIFSVTLEIQANEDLENLRLNFDRENLGEYEVSEHLFDEGSIQTWQIGSIKKGNSKSIEFRVADPNIFPVDVLFNRKISCNIKVKSALVMNEYFSDYEIRESCDASGNIV